MNNQEHALMMLMFTRQFQYIKTLENMLISNGIIQAEDPALYDQAAFADPDSTVPAFRQTEQDYRNYARSLGLSLPDTL